MVETPCEDSKRSPASGSCCWWWWPQTAIGDTGGHALRGVCNQAYKEGENDAQLVGKNGAYDLRG
ncbi:hypothetical protein JG687_00019182 [Phytophthora cactorum]|uniref:Uncharacterized protein n=1 Tax=Phytophthora cactorum TaxID=29920 RepID=A0A8T1TNL8_9STRA|nr:hypothetical protein JG687_00019182 [Phytophthora cactorum]